MYKYWFKDMSVFDGDYTSFETAIRYKYNWLWDCGKTKMLNFNYT